MYSLTFCAKMDSRICHTSQNKKHLNGNPVQLMLVAAMLVKVLTFCCWNNLNNGLWLLNHANKTWNASILDFPSVIVFTRNRTANCVAITCVAICVFCKVRVLFSYLALQWYKSSPPIVSSPSLWLRNHVWFWNVKIHTAVKLRPGLPKSSAAMWNNLLPNAQLTCNSKLF